MAMFLKSNYQKQLKKRLEIIGLFVSLVIICGCALTPAQFVQQGVAFSKSPETLKGELYLPTQAPAKVPAVVVVHGGSWVRRSGDMESISKKLAGEGIAAFNITYRSANQYPYPAAVDDVRQAIDWLKRNAGHFSIDAKRIGGWGYSAGGQLILRAGLDPSVGLKAIVSGGTPARFSSWPESPIISRFIGEPYAAAPERWEDASPVNHVKLYSPAVFLYHGAKDSLVEPVQMEFMAQALNSHNVPHQTHIVKGRGHIGTYLFADNTEEMAINFLKKWL